jgi:uncharacterized protein YbjT (DUF2867 family)
MSDRKLFIAGSTGAVGKLLVQTADARGLAIVPHVRPTRAAGGSAHPRAAVVELSNGEALARAMDGCTTVLQLIGTTRKRFSTGDTYESSDIGTTRQLIDVAKRVRTVDHVVLLSSVGAGKPRGAYLKAKARAEEIVTQSLVPFTILRPSAFMGAGHSVPGAFVWMTRKLEWRRFEPIRVEDLVAALLSSAVRRAPLNRVLEGESLWELVAMSRSTADADEPAAPQ